jgi:putative ATPase
MSDLWSGRRAEARERAAPLAWRMRPRTLDEFEGQEHIVGEGKLLRRMIESGAMTSIILHGPPGTGKTTLAEVIAHATDRAFERENAASVGVKRIREIIDEAATRLETGGKRTILFLDEIHRFSKSQQDVLLGDVERGMITLIGATTENPMFSVNSALVSRSTLFRLEPLSEDDVVRIVKRAAGDVDRGYGRLNLTIDDEALRVWAIKSDGDARRALTALEVAVLSKQREGSSLHISKDDAEQSIQQKAVVYAPGGDEHYDSISAMIKSVRGSDPDAAVYWIARMLEGGEDPNFIARRLAILASEDIGNADPRGIQVAAATWELVERIGMPEARITLSQCAIYLALAPKSNASYVAISEAMSDVKEGRTIPVPIFLQSGYKAESVGDPRFAKGREQYEYTHDTKANTSIGGVSGQDYLGVDKEYYRPTDRGLEQKLKERLEEVRRVRRKES